MAYKKYIRRGEKTYGPYIYHSRKVEGKVTTEYHGKYRKNVFLALIFISLVLILGIFFLFSQNYLGVEDFAFDSLNSITGFVINKGVQEETIQPLPESPIEEGKATNSGDNLKKIGKNELGEVISVFDESVGVIMMSKKDKDNGLVFFVNNKFEDKTFHNVNSSLSLKVMPERFVMMWVENDFTDFIVKNFSENDVFLDSFEDALFTRVTESEFVTHLESNSLKNSSVEIYDLPFGSFNAFFNSLICSGLGDSSSTGCQSIDSQNSQSSSVNSRVSLYLSNMSSFINLINALPSNFDADLVLNSSGRKSNSDILDVNDIGYISFSVSESENILENMRTLTRADSKNEIIIIDAEHLDENRDFVWNIFKFVNKIDGKVYPIPENEYVRAKFITSITNENIIDVVVQNSNEATVGVYEKGSDLMVGSIEIEEDGIYYIYLNHTGSQDTFDLKSIGETIEYDYIHDARQVSTVSLNITYQGAILNNNSNIAAGNTFIYGCLLDFGGGSAGGTNANGNWSYCVGGAGACSPNIAVTTGTTDLTGNDTDGQFQDTAGTDRFYDTNVTANTGGTYQLMCDVKSTDNSRVVSPIYTYTFTVTDNTPPSLNITQPAANNTNTTDTLLDILYTLSDAVGIGSVWYSNDSYSVNLSLGSGGVFANITNITWSQGTHSLRLYANDTSNNLNTSTITFTIDNVAPSLNITSPNNRTNSSDNLLDVL